MSACSKELRKDPNFAARDPRTHFKLQTEVSAFLEDNRRYIFKPAPSFNQFFQCVGIYQQDKLAETRNLFSLNTVRKISTMK